MADLAANGRVDKMTNPFTALLRALRRLSAGRLREAPADVRTAKLLAALRGEDVIDLLRDEIGHPVLLLASGRKLVLRGLWRKCPRCQYVPPASESVEADLLDEDGYVLLDAASGRKA